MKTCHKMKVYGRYCRSKQTTLRPEIRLLGYWLEKIGFTAGTEICVTILDDRILIEPGMRDENSLNELARYFEKEAKELTDVLKWVRKKGGINPNSVAADVTELTQKESGYRGRSSVIRKNGRAMDELAQEAIWEGIVSPNTSTDEFGQMIKDRVSP